MLRVAVVGSGPSGVYTAQALVEQDRVPDVHVHVLDRLPCPYGLVRYGVAPDHEKIKSLQNSLRTVLEHERITFLGNVEVGGDGIPSERIGELYQAVVYCVGAATDRGLAIPGEDLPGSCSATEFVSWYSAHPDAAANSFALQARSVVVIGVGNVAVDVARILARSAEELRPTDVPHGALGALAGSRVREVHMAGRRGPSQARFTTKELRELGALPRARVVVDKAELALDPAYVDPSLRSAPALSSPPNAPPLTAAARRNVEVLRGWAAAGATGAGAEGDPLRTIHLRFFLRPVELLERDGRVAGVRFARTVPDGSGGVRDAGTYEDIDAQLVLRAVGYRGLPLPGLPFDPARGTVPHLAGRVLRDGVPSPGEYVAGWIKRGPTGVIGSNRSCAKETVTSLLDDATLLAGRPSAPDPVAALRAWGLRPVEWDGWLSIERAEAVLGRSLGRGPVKIPDWAGLLSAADGGDRGGP
ncbi:FAD-dependent oxidoreductase [Streptomyces atratus]|uniref:ferredoxin--NADP(+) reductase n=1 Tax=Streptomyces atratus TaxID=1893 RepID=A0A2Z5J839_STRAR|nr:FAD-dependent oxidoreductase [Streptomyces atratus]AXE76506.1 NADP oxidoreductase [Streptomyces atratus]